MQTHMTSTSVGKTSNVLAMNCIILVLGMMLLTQFFTLLFHHVFSPAGWANSLNELIKINPPYSFQYQFIVFLKHTAPYSAYLFAAGLFLTGLCAVLLLARFYICILVSLGFLLAWTINWNDPGLWFFEFVFPIIFAFLAGLSMRFYSNGAQSIFVQLNYSTIKTTILLLIVSVLLYYVTYIAFKNPVIANRTALASSLTFFIIALVGFLLLRKNPQKQILETDSWGQIDQYFDFMIVSIGAMLLLQVSTNYYTKVFELDTFRQNLAYFTKASNAFWLHPILQFTVDNSSWILPIYEVFEICLSISLILLLLRGPMTLVACGLLGFLAFSELGASAVWPPDEITLTWQWELLLVTAVSLIIAIEKIVILLKNFSFKTFSFRNLILGEPFYYRHMPIFVMIFISVICGIVLYFLGIAAKNYIGSDVYQITSIVAGVGFAILMFILLLTNRIRK